MTQPTHSREAIQAAKETHRLAVQHLQNLSARAQHLDSMNAELGYEPAKKLEACVMKALDDLAKTIPPIPEPERPRIKSAGELFDDTDELPSDGERWGVRCIRAARAEIIALLEWENMVCRNTSTPRGRGCDIGCEKCGVRDRLLQELREADA